MNILVRPQGVGKAKLTFSVERSMWVSGLRCFLVVVVGLKG
jgi:hypothetical protein